MAPNDMRNGDEHQTPPPLPAASTSLSLGQTSYGHSRQRHNEIVKALRDCGIEEVVKLAKIAVIGNQSTGKSSLIEAISQIKVPRATGTCTRCPMEVILIKGGQWRAKVSLRIDYADDQNQQLGLVEFGETNEVDEVTIMLRRAQLAVLNPGQPLLAFQSLNDEECDNSSRMVNFSRNTIVLEITGAETDITFIDLPGIIGCTEKEEDAPLVQMIHDMVDFYVSQKECLILLTVTMKDDIDNQSAYSIAQQHDPHGIRTFGVLTKADTVPQGEHDPWLKIFNDKTHHLHRGWYMTRLADTINRDQPRDATLKNEFEFFQRKQPWSKLDKNRTGTRALTEALSSALSQMIEDTLPELKKEIFAQMKKINEKLDRLPESFANNPQPHLLSLCSAFITAVDAYTSGNPNSEPDQIIFLRDAVPIYSALEEEVRDTRPAFTIDRPTIPTITVPRCLVVEASAPCVLPMPVEESAPILRPPSPTIVVPETPKKEGISLYIVRKTISEMRTRELDGIIPFRVHEHFIRNFASDWREICLGQFEGVQKILKKRIDAMCKSYFGRFSSSGLYYEACGVVNNVLDSVSKHTREELIEYCRMENHRPFTMNKDAYRDVKNNNFYSFLSIRQDSDGNPKLNGGSFTVQDIYGKEVRVHKNEKTLLDILSAFGVHISSAKELMRIHKDEFEAEMDVVAHVLAYFDIASKRLIDDVPKIFETIFAKDFGLELGKKLTTDLNLVGEGALANCARYVKDEPEIQARRNELERQQIILNNAARTVDHFFKWQ